jgi:ribosomal protein RSM22 (predicted rRNA methylase)
VGQVGKEELERAKEKRLSGQRELLVSGESEKIDEAVGTAIAIDTKTEELDIAPDVMEAALMSESYKWPRLVFPPLKKSGHIILDCCTAEGTKYGSFYLLFS